MMDIQTLAEKARRIRLLAMDLDGVLTDGKIVYLSSGEELKSFNVKDGQGLTMAIRAGILTAIITARTSPINERRASELGIHHLLQNEKNKLVALENLLKSLDLPPEAVAYMGDDLPDLGVLKTVGLAACPADAADEVRDACDFVSVKPGGAGAMRELTDLLLSVRKN